MDVDKNLQFNEQAGQLLKKLKEKFTSEVVKQNPDYADEFMLIPHEALRRQMLYMLEVLKPEYMSPEKLADEYWKLDAWFEIYENRFYPCIVEHHDIEENITIPEMEKANCVIEPRVAADHVELMAMVEEIRELRKEENWKNIADLRSKFYVLTIEMFEHFKMEEEMIIPPFREKFNAEETSKIIDTIMKNIPLGGHKLFLPLILHSMETWKGGKDETKKWSNANLPGFIRFLSNTYWAPSNKQLNLEVFQAIKENNFQKFSKRNEGCCNNCTCTIL